MTILNVCVRPEFVHLGMDTRMLRQDESGGVSRCTASKLMPLCHSGSVLAAQGSVSMLAAVFGQLNTAGYDGFDQQADALPRAMNHAIDVLRSLKSKACVATAAPESPFSMKTQRLLLAGYSDERREMMACLFEILDGTCMSRTDIGGDGAGADWLSAWEPDQGVPPELDGAGALESILQTQVDRIDGFTHTGEGRVGGWAVTAEIRRYSINIRRAARLLEPARNLRLQTSAHA